MYFVYILPGMYVFYVLYYVLRIYYVFFCMHRSMLPGTTWYRRTDRTKVPGAAGTSIIITRYIILKIR